MVRRKVIVELVVMSLLPGVLALRAVGVSVDAAAGYWEASKTPHPISEQQAIADAMRLRPDSGYDYDVIATELEPTNTQYTFFDPRGEGLFRGEMKECMVIRPLLPWRFLSSCRHYPIWRVALSNQTCTVVVAIHALTGRSLGVHSGRAPVQVIQWGDAPPAPPEWAQPTPPATDRCGFGVGSEVTTAGWWEPVWEPVWVTG